MKAHEILFGALLGGAAVTAAHGAAGAPSRMPSLDGAVGWINTTPLTSEDLRGKVVLVDFWTFTCINWMRTMPWLRGWQEKYKNQGLVIIGVHSPEFAFESELEAVRRAVPRLKIDYPVAVDSHHSIWRVFHNQYWPALYIVDVEGRVRHQVFGEGDYGRAEEIIQQLLVEAGGDGRWDTTLAPIGQAAEAAADWNKLRSAETYLGSERAENFASPGGINSSSTHNYAFPAKLHSNRWALSGSWRFEAESVVSSSASAKIRFRFHARDLHIVVGPKDAAEVRFRVTLDGKAPGIAHGHDVDAQGFGSMSERRLYQLIRQPAEITDRVFEIEFLDAGADAYSFTFG
jgi:thiol-disulfide isomerase/thioredoxin